MTCQPAVANALDFFGFSVSQHPHAIAFSIHVSKSTCSLLIVPTRKHVCGDNDDRLALKCLAFTAELRQNRGFQEDLMTDDGVRERALELFSGKPVAAGLRGRAQVHGIPAVWWGQRRCTQEYIQDQ